METFTPILVFGPWTFGIVDPFIVANGQPYASIRPS